MALQPIDYGMQVQNPLQAAREGSAFGLKMAEYYNQQKLAEEKAQQEALQRQKMETDLMDLADNPSAENYTRYATLYPQLSEQLKRGYDIMSDGNKKRSTEAATQTTLLLNGGDNDGAKKLLNDYALAYENAGDANQAAAYKSVAKMIDIDPRKAKASAMMLAVQGLDGDQAAEFWSKLGKEQREQELQPYAVGQAGANIQKTNADIGSVYANTALTKQQTQTEQQNTEIKRAEANTADDYYNLRNQEKVAQIDKIKADQRLNMLRYELDSDKLDADLEWRYEQLNKGERKLDGSGQKAVNDAVTESVTLSNLGQQQKELAAKFRNSGQAGGLLTRGWEYLKGSLGIETTRSDMVREAARMLNSEAIKSLPPGPATDKDLELARKGVPSELSDGETLARYFDAVSRLNMAGAANKQMQAEWQSQNGSLGASKGDLDVLGVRVPKGITYQQFASSNMGKAIKQLEINSSKQSISQGTASYLKYGK